MVAEKGSTDNWGITSFIDDTDSPSKVLSDDILEDMDLSTSWNMGPHTLWRMASHTRLHMAPHMPWGSELCIFQSMPGDMDPHIL